MMAGSRRTSAGSPSSPRQRRGRSSRLVGASAVALVAALLLSGCFGSDPETAEGVDGDFADDGCTNVVVATSSEKVNMLDALADAFKDSAEHAALDTCATVHPINVSSGDATRYLTSGEDWPDENERRWPSMWSPASTVWTDRVAAAASPALVGEPASFTHTPVVFGVPETMARALGWPSAEIGISDFAALCSDPAGWGSVGKDAVGLVQDLEDEPEHLDDRPVDDPHAVVRGIRQDRRSDGGRRRRGRGLLARVRGVRHPLRRHDRQGALAAVQPDAGRRQRLGLRLGDRASRRPRSSTTTRATPTRTRSSPARRSRRRRRSSSRCTPRAARCGRITRSPCSAPTG